VTITHIPANDWAAIGARLERAIGGGLVVELSPTQGRGFWAWVGFLENGGEMTGVANNPGKSLLEALTAALDAAEGKQQ